MEWSVEGRLLRRTTPAGGSEIWTYDGEGNCVRFTDAEAPPPNPNTATSTCSPPAPARTGRGTPSSTMPNFDSPG
ncbi:RHS repeat domain-containing protein [Streptomyces sp. NPDC006430]|uniref:RHS repeat domain-containing protein n=1 Tax=Streptomyces sp. NPDC006430 TaxID=3154299 RepID=UPI0033AEBE70